MPVFIVPAAHGWNLVRSADQNGTWDVRAVANLEEAVPLLRSGDQFVLGLPISAVLAQRLRLPTVDPQEVPEMVRIQIEKALPYLERRGHERFRNHRKRRIGIGCFRRRRS